MAGPNIQPGHDGLPGRARPRLIQRKAAADRAWHPSAGSPAMSHQAKLILAAVALALVLLLILRLRGAI
jgi:hypothetical protein